MPMTTAEYNVWTFDFLRRRRDFVVASSQLEEQIEGHVIWGASVAAVARIHARRLGKQITSDRICFSEGLIDLAVGYSLDTVSIPLLAHDLKWNAEHLLNHAPVSTYVRAAADSEHWHADRDQELAGELKELQVSQPPGFLKWFKNNRYADILYRDFRCCALHGLDLGHRTMDFPTDGDPLPMYRNWLHDDEIPPRQQCRTRIMFPLSYLGQMLNTMIEAEEAAAAAAGWRVPERATLVDP